MCLLTSSNITALSPSKLPGKGSFSSFISASASKVTAVLLGGVEECPPSAFATINRFIMPFSATFIGAINLSTPGKKPLFTNDPSPSDQCSWMPSSLNFSTIKAAPPPPISSSWPKAKYTVLTG